MKGEKIAQRVPPFPGQAAMGYIFFRGGGGGGVTAAVTRAPGDIHHSSRGTDDLYDLFLVP